MRFVCHSNLLYATGWSEKYCEPSVTSDGYSAKKSRKEVHDVHIRSLGGCVHISICSKDRQNERDIGKLMRKGTRRRANCGAPTASAVLSVALFSDSTIFWKAIVWPRWGKKWLRIKLPAVWWNLLENAPDTKHEHVIWCMGHWKRLIRRLTGCTDIDAVNLIFYRGKWNSILAQQVVALT